VEFSVAAERAYGSAMTTHPNHESDPKSHESAPVAAPATITIRANGPLLVQGDVKVINSAGEEVDRGGRVAFCRCGLSNTKPFCDASHKAAGFTAE
jgi:Iron-binding zinc finger CDGSH type